jgi:hypothetical protein
MINTDNNGYSEKTREKGSTREKITKRGLLLTHVLKMIIENHVEAIENTIPKCSEAGERQNKSLVAGKVRCNDV